MSNTTCPASAEKIWKDTGSVWSKDNVSSKRKDPESERGLSSNSRHKVFFLGGDDVSKCKPSNLAVFVKRSVWKLDTCERSCMEYWTSTPMYAEFVRTTLAREGFLLVFWGEVLADLMSVVCHWWKNYEHSLLKLPVDPICQYAFFKEASNNVIHGNKKMCNISQTLRIFFCRQKLGGISPMVFVWRIDMVCKN